MAQIEMIDLLPEDAVIQNFLKEQEPNNEFFILRLTPSDEEGSFSISSISCGPSREDILRLLEYVVIPELREAVDARE